MEAGSFLPSGEAVNCWRVALSDTLVVPAPLESSVCRDADDDLVLATARTGERAAILTGDQDLLVLDPFHGIRVLAPSGFWKWESMHDDQ